MGRQLGNTVALVGWGLGIKWVRCPNVNPLRLQYVIYYVRNPKTVATPVRIRTRTLRTKYGAFTACLLGLERIHQVSSDEYDSYREYRVANTNMYSRIHFFLRGY